MTINYLKGKINTDSPLSEHPNPQFRREDYFSLNGKWDFEIDSKTASPNVYTRTIIVPFSAETKDSWINETITSTDVLHYRKIFSLPKGFNKGKIFLHFEGVDQICDIFLNGWKIGHHEGGYEPFSFELENLEEKNVLQVNVLDDTDSPFFPRGKQSNNPKGIWYRATSGIWQSVWIESTPNEYIKSLNIADSFEEKVVSIRIDFEGKFLFGDLSLIQNGKPYKNIKLTKDLFVKINLFGDFHPWSPDSPYLYDFKLNINGDVVYSYFAIRKISTVEKDGFKFLSLNNQRTFIAGVLDQGYYKDSGLTQPNDESLIRDILFAKSLGFNCIRKHIKIESNRWYYHCDRLGMLVIQDMVNVGTKYKDFLVKTAPFINYKFDDRNKRVIKLLGAGLTQTRRAFVDTAKSSMKRLHNHPCIFAWTIFNEGWGQFNSVEVYKALKSVDNTRLFDVTSGWYDTNAGDFKSNHVYFKKVKISNDKKRILFLSEFGGYSYKEIDHSFKRTFSYKPFSNKENFENGIKQLFKNDILDSYKKSGLAGYVYTQLTDVEGEINGLITFDRQVIKIDTELMKHLNNSFKFNQ